MKYEERLNEKRIDDIDKSGLFGQYEKWPIYAKEAIDISPNIPQKREIKNIIFIGMGGSATSGDIIHNWLRDELPVPFEVLKDYKLPGYVDNKTLVIAASISGETRETISACIEAKTKKDASVVSISAGGALMNISEKYNIPHTKVELALTPRASLLYALLPAINLLEEIGIIGSTKNEFADMMNLLNMRNNQIKKNIAFENNIAKQIASDILELSTPPTIYSGQTLSAPGYRFKASLNENSKIRAQHILLPELCHNEIQSWGRNKDNKITSIFLRDDDESLEQRERFESLSQILIKMDIKPLEIYTEGETKLGRIIDLIYLLDYVSLYLAILKDIDPTPTPNIDEIKKLLKNRFKEIN